MEILNKIMKFLVRPKQCKIKLLITTKRPKGLEKEDVCNQQERSERRNTPLDVALKPL